MSGRKLAAQRYAEDVLGVNAIWDDVQSTQAGITVLLTEQAQLEAAIYGAERVIKSLENDLLVSICAGELQGASVAAQERAHKLACIEHPVLKTARNDLDGYKTSLVRCQADLRTLELKHRGLVSRQSSLAAYLEYLAAARNANTVALTQGILG